MNRKTCRRCGVLRDLEMFQLNPQSKDGRHIYCRKCRSEYVRLLRQRDPKKTAEAARQYYLKNKARADAYASQWRARNADLWNSYSSAWQKSDRGREWRRQYRSLRKDKERGRWAVKRAIETGTLSRPNHCESCQKKCHPDAHHHKGYDRDNLLNVQWLCRRCHNLLHPKH